ncbi:MAG: hypothetical protein AB1394_10425, partial [Bacteroidota bacterium]
LSKNLNKDVIGQRLKNLGQNGSVLFQEYTFKKVREWITKSQLKATFLSIKKQICKRICHKFLFAGLLP